MPDATLFAALRATIRRLESGAGGFDHHAAALGHAGMDGALPWSGLPYAALHEIGGTIASAFTAALAGCFLRRQGALVWCAAAELSAVAGRLYGPGLDWFGIDAKRLILVRCQSRREVLWAGHEALRSKAVACVVLELEALDLLTGRRLQLAAEAGGAAGLILRFGRPATGPSAAVTRWRAAPFFLDDGFLNDGRRCWSLDLWRVKGGVPGHWLVRWDDATLSFSPAHQSADRPAAAEGTKARQRIA